jgi:hypothetical protein
MDQSKLLTFSMGNRTKTAELYVIPEDGTYVPPKQQVINGYKVKDWGQIMRQQA